MKCKSPFVVYNIFGDGKHSCCCNPGARRSYDDYNQESIKTIQKQMLSGECSEYCLDCQMYKEYEHLNIENGLYEISFSIDLSCNAVCRTCRDIKYVNIDEEKVWKQIKLFEDVYKQNINTVKKVVLMGGETTLFAKYIDYILSNILKMDNLSKIIIFTNGNNPNYNFFKMLSSYNMNNNIQILVSIDGDEKTNEIIRYGCKIENIKKTVEICKLLSLNTYTATTVSVFNIFNLLNVITFLKSLNIYNNKDKIKHLLNPLTSPIEYSCNILLKNDLENILENLNETINDNYSEGTTIELIKIYLKQCISSNLTFQEKLKIRMIFFKATKLFDYKYSKDSNMLKMKFENLNIKNFIQFKTNGGNNDKNDSMCSR